MALRDQARIQPEGKRKATYPANHKAAMQVPLGGSSCISCAHYVKKSGKGKDKHLCSSEHFARWHGSHVIPLPPDQYCSDWYEPAQKLQRP